MSALKITLPLAAILILCIGSGDADDLVYFDGIGRAVVQRISKYSGSFYTEFTDNTTLTVDREVYLNQIDLTRIYTYSDGQLVKLDDALEATVKIIDRDDGELFSGAVEIPALPYSPTEVKISPAIKLRPNHIYDIQVILPEGNVYGFHGRHEGDTFEVRSQLIPRPVKINFQSGNTSIRDIDDDKLKPSVGMITNFHLSRTSILDAVLPDKNHLLGSVLPNALYRLVNP